MKLAWSVPCLFVKRLVFACCGADAGILNVHAAGGTPGIEAAVEEQPCRRIFLSSMMIDTAGTD